MDGVNVRPKYGDLPHLHQVTGEGTYLLFGSIQRIVRDHDHPLTGYIRHEERLGGDALWKEEGRAEEGVRRYTIY